MGYLPHIKRRVLTVLNDEKRLWSWGEIKLETLTGYGNCDLLEEAIIDLMKDGKVKPVIVKKPKLRKRVKFKLSKHLNSVCE